MSLQSIAERFVTGGGVGICVARARGDLPVEIACAGLADRVNGVAVTARHLFKIGSCSKTFVAATLMALVEQRRLDLDTPVVALIPWMPGDPALTVRHLLNHRSGLPEFEYDIPMDPGLDWSPRQVVEFAFSVRTPTPRDERAVYSNTGYVLAGQVIEAVTGLSLAQAIRQFILTPLGLADMFCAAGEPFPLERLARGYYYRPPAAAGGSFDKGGEMWRADSLGHSEELQDSTALFAFAAAYAAGDLVGTAADLVTFLRGLFAGDVIGPAALDAMLQDRWPVSFVGTRMRDGGAGLFGSDYAGRLALGHQGGMPGYVTLMQHAPDTRTTAAITTNVGSGLRQHAYATAIHDVMDALLADPSPA